MSNNLKIQVNLEAFDKLTKPFKKVCEITNKLTRSVKYNRKELRDLKKLQEELGNNTESFTLKEIKLAKEIDRLTRRIEKQTSALQRRNKYLKQQKYLKEHADKFKDFGKNAIAPAVGGFLAVKGLITPGIEFEKSMSKVEALTRLDKTKSEDREKLQALTDQAKALGASTKFTSNEVADGQGYLAMAGFNPQQILDAMPAVLNASIAGDMGIAEASDMLSDMAGSFQVPADQMERVADVISLASTTANVDMRTMYETFKEGGPVMNQLGQSMESVAAMTGLLGNVGIKGSNAGTALKNIGLNMINNKHLKKLGIKVKDAKGNMRQIPEILADIKKATAKMGTADKASLLNSIFGKIPIAAAMELLNQADGKLQEYVEQMYKARGTSEKMAKTMADNVAGDLANLSSAWDGLRITVFEQLAPTIRQVTQYITELTSKVNKFTSENKRTTEIVMSVVAGLGALGTASGAVSLFIGYMISPIARLILFSVNLIRVTLGLSWSLLTGLCSGLKLLATTIYAKAFPALVNFIPRMKELYLLTKMRLIPTFLAFNATLFSNPITWLVLAIAGLIAGFIALWKNCDWFRNFWIGMWEGIKSAFLSAWEGIVSAFDSFTDYISEKISTLMGYVAKAKSFLGFGDTEGKFNIKAVQETNHRLPSFKAPVLATGLSAGLGSSVASLPAVATPMAKIDTRPPITASIKPTQNNNMTNNITINVASGDPQDIHKAVQKALDEQFKKQQVQRRASLMDDY